MQSVILNRIRRTTLFVRARMGFAAAIALFASRAAATPSAADTATAETLFRHAQSLIKQGKFSEACPKLVESNRLDPASGTLLELATCYEGEGKMASAWLALEGVKAIADIEKRPRRVTLAEERLAKVQRKLSRLTVNVSAEAAAIEGLEVRRDDSVVGHAALGVAVPVDQGTPRNLGVSEGGSSRFMNKVHAGIEGDNKTVQSPHASNGSPLPPGQFGSFSG